MELDDLLKNYREQIDTIDIEIIYLLSRRFALVEEIWNIKKENWENPLQPKRWSELLENLFEEARDKNVDKNLVKTIWNAIHKQSLIVEK